MTTFAEPELVLAKLDDFIRLTDSRPAGDGYRKYIGEADDLRAKAFVIEQILARLDPDWRDRLETKFMAVGPWDSHRDLAIRARAQILSEEEVRAMLGDDAPSISASALHPWVWGGAKSLWQSGHYRQAVTAASIKINAEAQNKVNIRRVSEHDLLAQLFSADPPKTDMPRLRLMDDDGSKTFGSLHQGVAAFARGCFMAIRNPNSHVDGLPELTEHEALEQLAAFSQLARWIDGASVETAS